MTSKHNPEQITGESAANRQQPWEKNLEDLLVAHSPRGNKADIKNSHW